MGIPGELVVVPDVPAAFAQHTIDAFRNRPLDTFSLALSGGATARRCYEQMRLGQIEAGVAAVYTPKDFEIVKIMGELVDLVEAHRRS